MCVGRALFPCGDAMVCIIDDREDVWKMAPNLIHVRPYHFFDGTADINAPPEASKSDADDESTDGGVSVKTTRRNIRIVRLPKKPKSDGCDATSGSDSAAESVIVSSENPSDNGTSINSESKLDVTVTTSESLAAGDCKEENVVLPASNFASDEAVAETSASVNLNSDCVAASSNSDGDHAAEERANSTADKDAATNAATDNATSDVSSSKPIDAAVEETTQEDEEYEEFVEWEDLDDYLVYLEDILRRIHTAYYELYDQMQLNNSSGSVGAAPDLKTIVPYVRRKVLKGARIVFSGVCPLGSDPTTCRIYRVAESLGAVVQSSVVTGDGTSSVSETTTHVVAARPGTEKVKAALRQKSAWIVNPDWVWTCADRWEWVDERLYPLNDETSARFLSRDSPDPTANTRKKDTSCNSRKVRLAASKTTENNGLDEYSLLTLSKEDISGMDAEVEKLLDENSDSEYEDEETETSNNGIKENQLYNVQDNEDDTDLRKQVLSRYCGSKRKYEESSDEESLSGDFPKGWKNSTRKRHRVSGDHDKVVTVRENNGDDDDDNDYDVKSDDSESGSSSASGDEDFNESVGSVDEEIAAAVEKEFLS